MSNRDVCSQCETNYVMQDDARCGICAECEAVLDKESDRRTKARAVELAFEIIPRREIPMTTPPPPIETPMTDRRICPTCCHFRDADVPCSDAFHIAPPSETKLKEAIDNLISTAGCVASAERGEQWGSVGSLLCNRNAARSSLESLYKELQDANDELETTVDLRYQEVLAGLRAELSALRSLQLTQAEANLLLGAMKHAGYDGPLSEPTREKLRSISSKATSEEL